MTTSEPLGDGSHEPRPDSAQPPPAPADVLEGAAVPADAPEVPTAPPPYGPGSVASAPPPQGPPQPGPPQPGPPQPGPPQPGPPQPGPPQPGPPPQGPPQPGPPQPPLSPAKGLALAALIVGICAFAVGFIPIVGVLAGVAAVVLGISALRKRQPKVLARTGAILGGVAIVASIAMTIGIATFVNNTANRAETAVAESEADRAESTDAQASEPDTDSDSAPADEPAVDPDAAAVPAEYTTALEAADFYANKMDMSKAGIYSQLTSEYGEGLSPESSQYAIDTVTADWEANALATAKLYQDEMDLAPADIRAYLMDEHGGQFTDEEADYALEHLND